MFAEPCKSRNPVGSSLAGMGTPEVILQIKGERERKSGFSSLLHPQASGWLEPGRGSMQGPAPVRESDEGGGGLGGKGGMDLRGGQTNAAPNLQVRPLEKTVSFQHGDQGFGPEMETCFWK